jgi:hypothetical protein
MAPKTSDAAIYLALLLSIVAALVSTPVVRETMADVRSDAVAGARSVVSGNATDGAVAASDSD